MHFGIDVGLEGSGKLHAWLTFLRKLISALVSQSLSGHAHLSPPNGDGPARYTTILYPCVIYIYSGCAAEETVISVALNEPLFTSLYLVCCLTGETIHMTLRLLIIRVRNLSVCNLMFRC